MKLRNLRFLALLLTLVLLVPGCETTDQGGDASVSGQSEDLPPGGNVRSQPYRPRIPSEVEKADYRFW